MPIARTFLNWDKPGLKTAAEHLAAKFGTPGELDLGNVVAAVPGGRAGRRLLEILVELADKHNQILTPPRIVTVGKLPELLYDAHKPFAGDLCQRLAWVEALKKCKPELLQTLVPAPPADDDLQAWLALADILARLHRELAADALDFSVVADAGARVEGFRESKRWQALASIQQQYLHILDGFDLWDLQTARLFAIRQCQCRTDAQIVLIGTVDLNRAQRMMLDQVAEQVTSLVIAPSDLADSFDEHGCLRADKWLKREIPLASEQIALVDDASDQAEAVVHALAEMDGQYAAAQISIGMPDEALVPYIEQHLRQCEIPARYGVGRSLAGTLPGRLLEAAADMLEMPLFANFAALVRHPSVQEWLTAQGIDGDWLSELDKYHADHIPYAIGAEWLETGNRYHKVRNIESKIRQLLHGLIEADRPLDQWSQPILDLLLEIFGRTPLDPSDAAGHAIVTACEHVRDVLHEYAAIPATMQPSVSGARALRQVLEDVGSAKIAPPPDHEAVELLGWLELPLDDAPALVLTTFNEGYVPSSLNGDLFLPNQLRRVLDIEDNDRRYARDAYAMSLLTASRQFFKVIVGRRTGEGDPMLPSRLLFACDDETMARRVKAFCATEEISAGKPVAAGVLQPGQAHSRFDIPKPTPLTERVTSMRVTEFKDYLACPYRYYLRHRLGLEALQDSAEEMDGAGFGTLAHATLREFGLSPLADSTDAEKIEQFLSEELDRQLAHGFGKSPLSAIRVQTEQLRKRLQAFARWQAAWAREGWRIKRVEVSPEEGKAFLTVDGIPMHLRGRIDRIDFHSASGRWTIIDYKSSDTPKDPDKTHRQADRWIDLQLPLYRHLVSSLGITGPVDLAYVLLPKDTNEVDIAVAPWSSEELQQADEEAAAVIRNVRSQRFWPPTTPPPDFSEDFAPICQDGQFRETTTNEEEGGIES